MTNTPDRNEMPPPPPRPRRSPVRAKLVWKEGGKDFPVHKVKCQPDGTLESVTYDRDGKTWVAEAARYEQRLSLKSGETESGASELTEVEEKLLVLDRRIARALFTLKNLRKRDGGPAWIAAQRVFDGELALVMDHLYGKTDDQPVYGAAETKGKNMSEKITKTVPDMPSFPPVPPGAPTGWICPKCGTVMGPHVRVCQMCSVPAYIVRSPGTHGVPDVQG